MDSHGYDQQDIESRLDSWIILIITAVAIGIGMGLINIVLGNFFKNADYTTNFIILVFGIIATTISLYLSFIMGTFFLRHPLWTITNTKLSFATILGRRGVVATNEHKESKTVHW
jgi:hypothetical protein